MTRLRKLLKGKMRRPRMVLGRTPIPLEETVSDGDGAGGKNESGRTPIPDTLDGVEEYLRSKLGNESPDVVLRRLVIWTSPELEALLFYIEGLTSRDVINMMALRSVMLAERTPALDAGVLDRDNIATIVSTHLMPSGQIAVVGSMELVMEHVLSGEGALFVEGSRECVLFEAKGWEHRGIEEPSTEKVVRGPREGFAELLRANTALIRRRLRTPDLRLDATVVGERSKTDIVVAYVEHLTNPDLVEMVKERIDAISVDILTDSGVLEELIEDHTYSPFPQVQYTERPDRFVAALSEGLVGILVDGSPMALMIPANLASFFQSPEDYYERFPFGGPLRTLRYLAGVIALIFPALYVAVATFHQEMIPTKLALAIAGSHVPVPFPSLVEALLMEVALELIREAAIRMPDPISQSLGFVGALLLGDAAVSAGLASPIMVIVVAVTGLSSLIIPHYPTGLAIRLLRFPLLFLSASLGLFGLIAGLIAIALHLGGLTSFGVPYLEPMMNPRELVRDVMWRSPEYLFQRRPEYPSPQDPIRQKAFMRTWIPQVAEKARRAGQAPSDSLDDEAGGEQTGQDEQD
ncbi:MAG: spore germination protein [Firmicutes bacterium]|nr:spore germination protein [Bacillota bacterium]